MNKGFKTIHFLTFNQRHPDETQDHKDSDNNSANHKFFSVTCLKMNSVSHIQIIFIIHLKKVYMT